MATATFEKQVAQDREYVNTIQSAPAFGLRDKIGYMLGDLGGNSLQVVVNTYMLLFLVNVVGIQAAHFALIIAVCRLLDSLNDPIIGSIVDRMRGRKDGKYKRWLIWVPIPMALLTVALFMDASAWAYPVKITYALLVYFFWGVVSSFWNIPYGTMLNSITTNGQQRTELSNFRAIGSTGASILVTTIAPLIVYDQMNTPQAGGFLILTAILGVFSVVCLFLTHRLTSERVVVSLASEPEKVNYLKVLLGFARNRPMIAIILSYITFKFLVQTINLMNQYVFMSYYQDTRILAAVGLGTLVPLILGMLLLKPAIKVFGKRFLTTWPLLIAGGMYLVLAFAPIPAWGWIGIQMVCSFFQGFFTLLIWALIADAVDYQAWLTKKRNDAIVYATVTFVVFLVASLSTSFIAIVVDAVGYVPALQANQTPEVAQALKTTAGLLPAIGMFIVFVIFKFVSNVSEERMDEIRAEVVAMSDHLQHELEEEEQALEHGVHAATGTGEAGPAASEIDEKKEQDR